jgi:hypothetical protein
LSPSAQITVQACHACIEATRHFDSKHEEHPHLVVLGVKDKDALLKCIPHLNSASIRYYAFTEPDRNNEVTAIATEPLLLESQRKKLRRFQCLK